ncbi:hypothetical protein MPSEU_000240800 [Mayamaea pseudoterrestris]|nr:hypothetical protein MPSEU_000240800 [Mayamaea pseudoterrestris]
MESTSTKDEETHEVAPVSTMERSSIACGDSPCVIADKIARHGELQLQVTQNNASEDAKDSDLHQRVGGDSTRTPEESPANDDAPNSNVALVGSKSEESSDELANACYQFMEGSVPGSCDTESSRSSPSNDGYSLGDGAGGRPRSSSLDSKRSTKSKSGNGLRRGKWTLEEENYVARVIQDFNSGFLDAPAGTTLRTYLSEKLQCDPMRITKKFTGDACIGKRVFHPAVRSPGNASAIDRAQAELEQLEIRWRTRLEMQQRESAKKAAATAAAAAGGRSSRENVVTRTASWLERAESVLHPTESDKDQPLHIQTQIQEVERLIHEGPNIQETSVGLPDILREAQERASSGSPDPEHTDKRLRTANQDAEALVGFLRSVHASEASGQEC